MSIDSNDLAHRDLGLRDLSKDDANVGGGCCGGDSCGGGSCGGDGSCGGGSCGCGNDSEQQTDAPVSAHATSTTATSTTATTTDYLVQGMTCGHCVASVTEELTALDGVQSVAVELDAAGASRVTVAANAPLSIDAVRAAVDEAGYSLVDPR